MRRSHFLLGALAIMLLSGCVLGTLITPDELPAACQEYAADVNGTVAASFPSTVGEIQQLPAVGHNPQLAAYDEREQAVVCYVNGELAKAPPPDAAGNAFPSFDRAVLVVIGDERVPAAMGWADRIPLQAP